MKHLLSFLSLFILIYIYPVQSYIHAVGEEEYQVLLSLVKGTFDTPKDARSNIEKAAVVKFWRAKGRFTADGKILLYDSKVVRVFLSCPIFRAGSHYAITCINLRLFHGILGSNWVTNCANSFCYYLIGPNFAGPNCVILGAGVKLGPALIKTGDLKAATLKKKKSRKWRYFFE